MKRWAFPLIVALAVSAFALDGEQVKYVGGTASVIEPGVRGRLDTIGSANLIFRHADRKLEIPYSSIQSFECHSEVAHHLGVLPAIAVGLVKARRHRHLIRIVYKSPAAPDGGTQVVVFEVSKTMAPTLNTILLARAPHRQTCPARAYLPRERSPNSTTEPNSPDRTQPAAAEDSK